MKEFFDELETRSDDLRSREQFERLRKQVHHLKAHVPAYSDRLKDIDPESVIDRDTLGLLPVTRKSELAQAQSENPPLGGFSDLTGRSMLRIFASPGAIFEPQANVEDFWRTARALFAAGCRSGDLVYNTFSYHFTPAGFMLEGGAHKIGCTVFPAGVGQSELQVQAIAHLKPSFYVGTPSFLSILSDMAEKLSLDISSLKYGLVSGEALPATLRDALSSKGVKVLQAYATADVGLIAYESSARDGLIIDEDVIVEIVRPGTGDPVSRGEVGEVLVTPLSSGYPLIRFATGDLSAFLDGASACGRTGPRIKGWMGRADQTTKVRGMFVHPEQVATVISRHSEIIRARLVVTRIENSDAMTLKCEISSTGVDKAGLVSSITDSVRAICKLRTEIAFEDEGALPNDGKVIDDQRPID
ncbi:MAG: phenylacetate--CoA ligase family protein [Candidatus Thioglobus sp.]|nr:MAG: phenylacetate--CoA ligase family protein [Candidatus Thioglobus sp.]